MLTLHHSNHLDILKELLVDRIRSLPLDNPLTEEQILVQSPGMARWLQLELASAFGIAAAIAFPLPATFLWEMFVTVLDDVPKRSAFAKESMTWKLMGLLESWKDQPGFEPLAHYLQNDDDRIRRYQLAGKIADIYDQYLVYRPEWIASWEARDDLPQLTAEQSWQPILWRALVERTRELGQPHWHRANMHQTFADILTQGNFTGKLPKRLFVFGISALPPGYVQALHALGQHCDVHLMVTNPCRYYWGDIRDARYLARINARRFKDGMNPELPESLNDTGNPLLASLGKLGRDYLYQLQELSSGEQTSELNPVTEIDGFADINTDSLLHHIQHDILELQDSTGLKHPIKAEDHSISFRGCHSPLREVEVLHDHLLSLFENDSSLTPRDIIVMVPDIDSYSPYLQAVFSNPGGSVSGERYIPFALSDRSASQEHPAIAALQRLLTLDQNRASTPELIELLEVKAIQNRFGLEETDINTLARWIEESGIRWGINEQHQSRFDVPTRAENTWLFGLRRMLLGYAMPSAMGLYDDTLPSDLAQGMEAELAGKLADFVEHCEWLLAEIDTARDADHWLLFINQLLELFFAPDETDEPVIRKVRESMEKFREQLNDARFTETLPKAVLVDWLNEHLGNTRSSQRFLAGQVNICTLMPMRSIPFKVVCLLGMNDSAYPRSLPPMGFDLMAKEPRRGDRSRREDDRYLFLEALLSAQEQLYISYVSRNIRDNTERFPSVLVTELQNLIKESFVPEQGGDGDALVNSLFHQHSLQAFSPDNFIAEDNGQTNRFQSFASEWLPAASGEGEPEAPFLPQPLAATPIPDEDNALELPLDRLIGFWNNSSQAFCQQRLKVYFNDDDEAAETREPFALDGLTGWNLKDQLVNGYLQGMDDRQFRLQARASGVLPHGSFGQIAMNELQSEASQLADLVAPWVKNKCPDREIDLPLNHSRLTGWLDCIYDQGQVFWRTGKLRDKHRFQAWVKHLCYCAGREQAGSTFFLTLDNCIELRPVEQERALSMLADLEQLMQEGLNRPLPFFQKTAWTWIDKARSDSVMSDDEDQLEEADNKARKSFIGDSFFAGEGTNDAYIQRCWPDFELALPELRQLAQNILLPLASHLHKLEADK
ncbi:exodeoxyribonuclease V subunit gamma [Parendozoicomonas haliclonae]|uniref:RecBCD enzyme subunit RecC n=1 Tax=Parendozoicomonas haliclonae TaxID=1960125 RepID=A0A1X7AJS9_9GAMM|nr:exodeoxyribonuclease V subunit gamma [Parendozoicomonas haliclonae]SMA47155.1 RecBCD enzyme subunit RecC [Parendozoicomonas haliclonae]